MRAWQKYAAELFGTFVLVFFLSFLVNLQRQFQIFSMLRSDPRAPQVSSPAWDD